jgi:membrane protein
VVGTSAPRQWLPIARLTLAEIQNDRCLALAAQLAFYFLLALFPALLFLVALVGMLPAGGALRELLTALDAVAPRELVTLLRTELDRIASGGQTGLLTAGIVGAIWTSSAAMTAIIEALNRAYDVTEWRPWWKRRLVAVLLTLALAAFTLTAMTLVLVGPDLAARIAAWLRLAPVVAVVWAGLRWPVMILLVMFALDLIFHFAPNRRARWRWLTPGAVLATVLWMLASFGFKAYVSTMGDYAATYGAIGGAIVAMLWFYLSGLAILAGAELNSVLDQRR